MYSNMSFSPKNPFTSESGKGLLFTIRAGCGRVALNDYRNRNLNSPRPSHGLPTVYRSQLLNNLSESIRRVGATRIVVEMRKSGRVVSQATFDVSTNSGSVNAENWFTPSRLVSSTPFWMGKSGFLVFSIAGHRWNSDIRSFYIQYNHGGCEADRGFMGIGDSPHDGCGWVSRGGQRPVLFYASQRDTYVRSVGYADQFLIYFTSETGESRNLSNF